MSNWYDQYCNLPYKHLGDDPVKGIDCVNLCRLLYKNELGFDFKLKSSDFCNILEDDWYTKTHSQFLEDWASSQTDWIQVKEAKKYDLILMSMGSTNVTNHIAVHVGDNKILQTMLDRTSGVWPYRGPFKQYTTRILRWKNLIN